MRGNFIDKVSWKLRRALFFRGTLYTTQMMVELLLRKEFTHLLSLSAAPRAQSFLGTDYLSGQGGGADKDNVTNM